MATLSFFDILALQPNFFSDAEIDVRLDREEIKMAILERCGTLLPLYTNSHMFKQFSDSFFKQRKQIITKLIDSTQFEYNPIDNYDRKEDVTRKYKGENQSTNTVNAADNRSSGQESKVSAYDSEEYLPKENVIGTSKDTSDSTAKESGSNAGEETITTRTHGNIGVTTTQQMIESERKVSRFNIYNWIAIEFEQHFFICVS